jgi:hypothetical protein
MVAQYLLLDAGHSLGAAGADGYFGSATSEFFPCYAGRLSMHSLIHSVHTKRML